MRLTDVNLNLSRQSRLAKGRVILTGLLSEGPVGQPFTLPASKSPIVLGDTATTRTAAALLSQGIDASQIVYYRLNGTHARLNFKQEETLVFDIVGVTANEKQNNVTCTVSPEGLTLKSHYELEQLDAEEQNYVRTYRFDEYPYLEQLASAINQDAVFGIIDVMARNYTNAPSNTSFTPGIYRLDFGENGSVADPFQPVVPSDYFQLFGKHVLGVDYQGLSYQPLMTVPAELMLYPDVNIDEMPEIGTLAAGIAKQKTDEQGLLASALFQTTRVPTDGLLTDEDEMVTDDTYYSKELDATFDYEPYRLQHEFSERLMSLYTDDELSQSLYDHLMVVIGDMNFSRYHSAVPALAGLILTSSPSDSLTNQALSMFLGQPLERSIVAKLTRKGYICTVPSVRRGVVPSLVQNMRSETDQTLLTQWSNLRLVSDIRLRLGDLMDKYIGRPFGVFTLSKLEQELNDYLAEVSSYSRVRQVQLGDITQDHRKGSISLSISLSLASEVRTIQSTMELTNEGWEIDLWNLVVQ